MRRIALFGIATAIAIISGPASAGERRAGGKLLLTNGVSNVEGAAGGGLATWAVIAGNETRDGIGGSAHATLVALPDFDLESYGAAIGINDRIELSYAYQSFDTRAAGAALGLGRGFTFGQHVIGAKLRIAGDAIWEQDRWLPQIAVGVQHRIARRGAVIRAVGGQHDRGTDFYVAATKVLLSRSLLLNGTVRYTKANQFGLLGFGGDRHAGGSIQAEGSAGLMLSRRFVVGTEYRTKPDNLGFAREQDAWDAFAALAVTRNVSLTAAYADLGDIATVRNQHGAFLSVQGRSEMLALTVALLLQAGTPPGEEPVDPYPVSNANAGATPFAGDTLWRAFHGTDGVSRVVDDFVARNVADPRISDIFKSRDLVRLRRTLKEQFCYILGGGCAYTGRDMRASHKDLGIQQADMAALVENLQAAMRREHVSFAAQNRLLAKLAPMHRDIVVR